VELFLGPGVQDESSVLFIAETFSITLDADLAVRPFESTLRIGKVIG
jgi:hypothetical protein